MLPAILLSLLGPVVLATHSNFWHQNPLKPRQSRNRLVDSNCSSEDGSEREAGRWHLQAQAQARQISFIATNNLSGLADWIAPLALHRSAFTWESRLNIYCFLTSTMWVCRSGRLYTGDWTAHSSVYCRAWRTMWSDYVGLRFLVMTDISFLHCFHSLNFMAIHCFHQQKF